MSKFELVAKLVTMGAIAVLASASFAVAEQGGQYWVPTNGQTATYQASAPKPARQPPRVEIRKRSALASTNKPAAPKQKEHHLISEQGGQYWVPTNGQTATYQASAPKPARQPPRVEIRKRSALASTNKPAAPKQTEHHLILQVTTNDAAAMNLALNNATNVTDYYKGVGEKVIIEVVTFGPGLHMLREDTSPVKVRIEEMVLSMPEVAFKACGNTKEMMQRAENKSIPIIQQAEVVKSGVVRVMELEEKGWTYVKP